MDGMEYKTAAAASNNFEAHSLSQQVDDHEMAVVSESMAHASLTPPNANAQSSEGGGMECAVEGSVNANEGKFSNFKQHQTRPNQTRPKQTKNFNRDGGTLTFFHSK